jgi:hypothetical protein
LTRDETLCKTGRVFTHVAIGTAPNTLWFRQGDSQLPRQVKVSAGGIDTMIPIKPYNGMPLPSGILGQHRRMRIPVLETSVEMNQECA